MNLLTNLFSLVVTLTSIRTLFKSKVSKLSMWPTENTEIISSTLPNLHAEVRPSFHSDVSLSENGETRMHLSRRLEEKLIRGADLVKIAENEAISRSFS